MGTILGQIFCIFHKDGCILGRNFLYISVKWVHFSGKNVWTSKIHREPPPGQWAPTAAYNYQSNLGSVHQVPINGWVDRGSVEYKVCTTLLHKANTENWTPDLLILSPMHYPLGHMLPPGISQGDVLNNVNTLY